jgi:hypothetical protein
MLDGDEPGRKVARAIGGRLMYEVIVQPDMRPTARGGDAGGKPQRINGRPPNNMSGCRYVWLSFRSFFSQQLDGNESLLPTHADVDLDAAVRGDVPQNLVSVLQSQFLNERE